MKVLRSLAAAPLFVLVLTSAAAPAGHVTLPTPGRPASQRAPGALPTPPGGPALQAKLPDTTLVRIFFAKGHTDVTLSQLRVGAYKLGAWPDSLTPQDTRQVLGLLVQQAILTHRVHQEARHWTAADSSDYRLFEDRLTLSAALDSALVGQAYRLAARGDSVPDREGLGIMVRDSALVALHPVYDEYMLQMLAAGFAARPKPPEDTPILKRIELASAPPAVSRADSARTLITTRAGSYTVGQLLSDLGRVGATRRPQVRGVEDLRDLCRSKVYEMLLRQAVTEQGIAHKPRIARQLAERAELIDVQRFVGTQVYEKIPLDSTTLRRRFKSAPSRFVAPASAVVVRTVFEKREEADTLARKLTLPLFAESLLAQSTRAGVPYRAVIDERSDSVLVRRAQRAGVGAVVGPDRVRDGWRVLKVMELARRHPQTFEDAFAEVRDDWGNTESNRRMRELMTQLAAASIVNVNQASPYLTGRKRIPR